MANVNEETDMGETTPPPKAAESSIARERANTTERTIVSSQNNKVFGSNGNLLGSFCAVKLNHDNYLLWKNMVLPVIKGNRLEGYITGSKPCPPEFIKPEKDESDEGELVENPDFEDWMVRDQILLGWLYNSMEPDVASEVMGFETSKSLWDAVKDLFGVKTRSNIVYYKREFQKMQKGELKMSDYLKTMKKLADNLTLAGHLVPLEDLVSQVLAGLDSHEYNPVVCQLQEKETVTWLELQGRLLSYERRLEQMNSGIAGINLGLPVANFANRRGGGNLNGQRKQYQPHNTSYQIYQGGNRYAGNSSRGNRNFRGRGGRFGGNSSKPTCQVCGKLGHTAATCYHRFNSSYMGSTPSTDQNKVNQVTAFVASPETLTDSAWYVDSGASNHITNDVNTLQQRMDYNGKANLIVGNGERLNICSVGNAWVSSNNSKELMLKDILHVPQIERNLLSISELIASNNIIVEFNNEGCFVKDKVTGEMLLLGKLEEGLYRMELPSITKNHCQTQSNQPSVVRSSLALKHAFVSKQSESLNSKSLSPLSLSSEVWHKRLGHPSNRVLQTVMKSCNQNFKINEKPTFCDACQYGKSHLLPFAKSISHALKPLELIHTDIWGPSPINSSSGNRFYIHFIDDFSRYTWIYPLKSKSEALTAFI